jgi:hypothetical protein
MNQGPRGFCLMKKTEGRKSRDTVPFKRNYFSISLYYMLPYSYPYLLQCVLSFFLISDETFDSI